jgi:hypothetical protein
VIINAGNGRTFVNFEELIAGSPEDVTVIIEGCRGSEPCDELDRYRTGVSANRSPRIDRAYDRYFVTPIWTGGTNASVSINATVSSTPIIPAGIAWAR